MINFTKRYVNTVSLIISIIIVCLLNNNIFSNIKIDSKNFFISNQVQLQIDKIKNDVEQKINENKINCQNEMKNNSAVNNTISTNNEKSENNKTKENKTKNTVNWQIEIPAINLKAEIAEGTTKEIMDAYVGHFEDTSKDKGNVGLAAHNRGYKVNYFQNLKKLKEGDEIIYTYNGKQRKYEVKTHKIIKDVDWEFLEKTEDNRITLITCVENEPEYRRCIQGIEVK